MAEQRGNERPKDARSTPELPDDIHVHLKMYAARSKMPASSSSRRMVEARAFVFEIHNA
jgi:hypothetical protein